MTLHELAAVYGVSAERIRQIEAAAMKKMKKAPQKQLDSPQWQMGQTLPFATAPPLGPLIGR